MDACAALLLFVDFWQPHPTNHNCASPLTQASLQTTSSAQQQQQAALPPPQPPPLREIALPYRLQDKPHPPGYVVLRVCGPTPTTPSPPAAPITIDGSLDDAAWAAAEWSGGFVDIVGETGPAPWFKSAFKAVWDDEALYLAVQMEDTRLFANQTKHDG